jgi:preprotein translocase subunit SecG
MKYEADDGCISGITGENLCLKKTMWIALCVLIVVLMIVLAFYKKKIVRKK